MSYRLECDSMGQVQVPSGRYWGAQTQRSKENFKIGRETMPMEIVHAFGALKRACALANHKAGKLDALRCGAVVKACEEVAAGKLDENFPLVVWQTGSGTQSNMNVNEVIANRAVEILGANFEDKASIDEALRIHPNDHVNMSQSSNDTFPSALHIMAVCEVTNALLPAIASLQATFEAKTREFADIIKCGRTHLQDATPLTLGQEFSGYAAMMKRSAGSIAAALEPCRELAIGGTAVGTGLNAPVGFGPTVCDELSRDLGVSFKDSPNKFLSLTSHDAVVFLQGALAALAGDMLKISNDIRWMASGPRGGLAELTIPANEPGSSIMPGKVNPTQCEAVAMVCVQVMGNAAAVNVAASQGNFELNVYQPVIAHNVIQSIRLLADVIRSFNNNCAVGIKANEAKIDEYMTRSLMLVTALSPVVGYMNAAKIAHHAHEHGLSLREAALDLKLCSAEAFDEHVRPENMIGPR